MNSHRHTMTIGWCCFRAFPQEPSQVKFLTGFNCLAGVWSVGTVLLYNCTSEAFAVGDTGDFIIGRARADLVLLIQRSLHQGMGSNALIYDRSFLRVM